MKIPFITAIWNWISGAVKKVKEVLSKGNKVANIIKDIVDSPLLDIAVNLTATPLDNGALLYLREKLPIWMAKMNWAEKKISDFDETTLPHVMNAINAEASKLIADFEKVELTRQQAIASAQVVYSPEIVK